MPLPRPARPSVLIEDLRAFVAQRTKHQWIALFFALTMPIAILVIFSLDAKTNIMPGERVIIVESWSADRSDEQIKADQQVRQREKERADAERRRQWKSVGERLGMDP